ncbi:hypothetical protein [Pseudobutyrivibrio ruminis]|uniref:hypothetical protein n=1 Tax=Pseudobutyrivibrio ruminis TaxID=46206 RepID=UPI0004244A3A|nr:hypothetical protein [Pseudobutyrivibrio ruminis]
MRNKKNYTQEESTLLQDIVRAYRYPDGTLNGIAVFISTLALVLLLIFGHFTINGIKHVAGLNKVSASELDLNAIEQYITGTYLDAIDDYTGGKIDHDTAKRRILKQLAAYANSSDSFTNEQKTAIQTEIEEYLKTISLDEYMTESTNTIQQMKSSFEKSIKENERTIELVKSTLKDEIENNKNLTDDELTKLNELYNKIKKLEASDINQVNSQLNEVHDELSQNITNNYNSFIYKLYDGIDEWSKDNSYTPNTYVMYNNVLYRNITGVNTDKNPSADKDNWEEASITSVINNNYQAFINTVGAGNYNPLGRYQAGDYVIYDNRIYKNVSGSNGTPGSSNDWEIFSITDCMDEISKDLQALELKNSTDLAAVNKSLIDLIKNNKSLTDEQQKAMINLINSNSDSSKDSLDNLYKDLMAIINQNESSNTNEREKLIEQFGALKGNTAAHMDDFEQRISNLEDRTTSTDESANSIEFRFGYERGTYGFYTYQNEFKPF